MPFTRVSKTLVAVVGALALATTPADAHSGHAMSVTLSTYSPDAYPNMTISVGLGAYEPTDISFDFGAGMKFAHADGMGTEVTPNPNDGETIGNASHSAALTALLCATATQSYTVTWDEDMTGAPTGAVAHYVITNTLGFDVDAWLIEQNDATDDYALSAIDLDETRTCSTQPSSASYGLSIVGTTASGGHPYRNPSPSGCYGVTATFVDTAAATHTASGAFAIGTATCP